MKYSSKIRKVCVLLILDKKVEALFLLTVGWKCVKVLEPAVCVLEPVRTVKQGHVAFWVGCTLGLTGFTIQFDRATCNITGTVGTYRIAVWKRQVAQFAGLFFVVVDREAAPEKEHHHYHDQQDDALLVHLLPLTVERKLLTIKV